MAIPERVGEDALPSSDMISAGHILGGRYRLLDQLGKGGMGTVWRAEHVELGSQFAVKLIHDDLAESSVVRARFRREAQAAAALGSDHVVRTLDYGVEGETPYIVMELLTGESLQQRLTREGKLSPAALSEILSQVALALDKAHDQGMIHRDLKPGNLFITRADDGHECIKLLDFGTAKLVRKEEEPEFAQTRTGAMVGSPAYMSPEQLRGQRDIGPGADIWALGVVAYECLLGQRPFHSTSLAGLAVRICSDPLPVPSSFGQVPTGFDAWFARACDRDPLLRFQRTHDLAEAFGRMLTEGPTTLDIDVTVSASFAGKASPDSPSSHDESTAGIARSQAETPRRANRFGQVWLYGAGVAVVAFGLLGFSMARSPGPGGEARGNSRTALKDKDAGSPPLPAAAWDAGTAADVQRPPADVLAPVRSDAQKHGARPVGRTRGRGNATERPAAPADKTDGVYGF